MLDLYYFVLIMGFAGIDLYELKNNYGTPLYIFDVNRIKTNIGLFKKFFKSNQFDTEIIYASKALNIKEMLRIIDSEWICLDCVSIWEIYTALDVNFPVDKIYFHWNNKTFDDIRFALENGIWTVVVDNVWEMENLYKLCDELKKNVNILVRLNVGVEAHTHKFIVTAHVDSKFWVIFWSEEYVKMMSIINKSDFINFLWFHSHIGSQIFDLEAFKIALEKLVWYCKSFEKQLVLNVWWGFAVHYTNEDKDIPISDVSKNLVKYCEETLVKNNVKIKKLCIEPWRSIVWEAWATLYTLWYIKKTPNKEYYFIDWWMTDNIRPALYQAKYDADIVWKENLPKSKLVTVAGKCCESGDLIVEDCPIQDANSWDLMIVYTTWAYWYSMSSNYNKMPTPAVVFVEDWLAKLVVKRQTFDQLIEREI